LCILQYSCVRNEKVIPAEEVLNEITLIFINAPDNGVFHTSYGSKLSLTRFQQIRYVNEQMINTSFTSKKDFDTLTISVNQPYLEVFHAYKGLIELSYLIEKGDTITFTYDGFEPKAVSVKNKNNFDLNLSIQQHKELFGTGWDTMKSYLISPFEEQMNNPIPHGTEGYANKKYQENTDKNLWLDKGFESSKISSFSYNYYKKQLKFDRLAIENELESIKIERFQELIKTYQDTITYRNYFLGFTRNYLAELSKNAPIYDIQTSGGGGRFKDFTYIFDKIEEDTILNNDIKDILYYETLELIIENIRKSEISRAYYQKFKSNARNKNLVTMINDKYHLEKKITNELRLESILGKTTTLKEVLNQHRGKVIYVDLWSSWCKPCLKELPYIQKIASHYSGNELVVLFISKDENEESWKEYSIKNKLNNHENYRVTNAYSTTFFEEINQQFIPFYLLYDKNGRLDYIDAPRPSNPKIHEIIKQKLGIEHSKKQ
jgi:thiol-disulfide isomerase/thioredoxin